MLAKYFRKKMCVYGIFLYFCSVFINKLLRYS